MQLLAGRLPLPACPSRSLALQSTAGPRAVASKADRGQQASLRPPAPPPHRAACRCAAALAAPHRPCCTTPDDDLPLEDVAAWAPLQPDYALGHEVRLPARPPARRLATARAPASTAPRQNATRRWAAAPLPRCWR